MTSPTPEQLAEFVAASAVTLIEQFEKSVTEMTRDPMAPAYFAGLAEHVLKIEIEGERFRIVPLPAEPDDTEPPAEYQPPGYL
ncbi:hypothetical protein ACFYPC_04670 [Streptomyces sp. NPDC005808]|uniref:hypothetical protein n=1 Tax=Streptomyces sp. NPDC005808 TaxID=3364734 RepID=UPI0036C27697